MERLPRLEQKLTPPITQAVSQCRSNPRYAWLDRHTQRHHDGGADTVPSSLVKEKEKHIVILKSQPKELECPEIYCANLPWSKLWHIISVLFFHYYKTSAADNRWYRTTHPNSYKVKFKQAAAVHQNRVQNSLQVWRTITWSTCMVAVDCSFSSQHPWNPLRSLSTFQ